MQRKSEETPSNADQQPIQSNPYAQTNNDQQYQTILERIPDEPPPAYNDHLQSSFDPKQQTSVQNTAFNNQVVIPPNPIWGREPIQVACPYCRKTVLTRVKTSSSIITVLLAILLALFCLCLAVIPFFSRRCKKTTHYCPDCHQILREIPEFQ